MSERPSDAPIRIRAETSVADPDTCKFIVDRTVHPGGPVAFDRRGVTDSSPLPARLFVFDDVSAVVVADTTVSVTKVHSASWEGLRAQIGAEIRAHLHTGLSAIAETSHTGRDDDQVRAALGGKISIVELTNGVLSIAMSGGCQGCASSTATLRDGFETMARRVAPELTQIVDTTNHAAGAAPFYAQSSVGNDDSSPLHNVQLGATRPSPSLQGRRP
jgi:Fe-S cluster biogenesis protein NfuA